MNRVFKILMGLPLLAIVVMVAGCTAPYFDDGVYYDEFVDDEPEIIIICRQPLPPPPPPIYVSAPPPPRTRPLTKPEGPRIKTPRPDRGADKPMIVRHKEKSPDPVDNRLPRGGGRKRR